jgi:hypothetical protein
MVRLFLITWVDPVDSQGHYEREVGSYSNVDGQHHLESLIKVQIQGPGVLE